MSQSSNVEMLEERRDSILCNSKKQDEDIECDQHSVAGAVSQRACVYSGARVVLNPITDAYHLVHGPIGCASYTWDIRGSLSNGPEVYRNSFSTDLREEDIVFGGEEKLTAAIAEIVKKHSPEIIFIYSTCVVGVIGDDLKAVCKTAEKEYGIPVIPVQSSGFAGNKSSGYKAACNALLDLLTAEGEAGPREGINILGDFNLAGEMWIMESYFKEVGIKVNSKFTGDATYAQIKQAPQAELNIVQCAGSMAYLARKMEQKYDIPYIKISFFGVEDTIESLREIAAILDKEKIKGKVETFVKIQRERVEEKLNYYRKRLQGKSAAIYVGGGFKAISLIKQFNELGMRTVMVGTQNGSKKEYRTMKELTEEGTIILDDANPSELEEFIQERGADILVGGTKERPLAYKLGIAFCDHNHSRKHPLSGFEGVLNFAKEVDRTVNSPVWKLVKREVNSYEE